jgi:hypothetical protein
MSSTTDKLAVGGYTFSLFTDFNFKLFLYIIVAIIIEIVAIVYATSAPMYLAAVLFVPLSLFIFIVYGIQWFGPDGIYKNGIVPWPPVINSCPDYLVAITTGSGTSAVNGCVDPVGISSKGDAGFKRLPTGQFTPSWSTPPVKGDTTQFVNGFFAIIPNEELSVTCSRLQTAGLTWDGVYDGATCFNPNGSSTVGSSSAGNCPT